METTNRKGYARLFSAQSVGAGAKLVTVEADLTRGLHTFSVIGLANRAVDEARDRINAAIRHAGYPPPKACNKRIVLSLSPADLRKEGSQYDLALALSYLIAAGEVKPPAIPILFNGELALDGTLRGVPGVLPHVMEAREAGIKRVFIPPANAAEALLVSGVQVFAPATLGDAIAHLAGTALLTPEVPVRKRNRPSSIAVDLHEIKGQESAKRALEIAAVGRHNLVLYGPPGTGKTLLARTLPGILPPLTHREALETTALHSTAGILSAGSCITEPPLRTPHHTASPTALIGGGISLRPGEVTLAHNGILFMDEFSEFSSHALEALRQPLEDHMATVVRAKGSATYPADFMLVAAMNPAYTLSGDTTVLAQHARAQARRLSRPIIDRIDLWVEVPNLPHEQLTRLPSGEYSSHVRARVQSAREFGVQRLKASGTPRLKTSLPNSRLPTRFLEERGGFTEAASQTLSDATRKLDLSPRSYYRVMRVARTIADLDAALGVGAPHVMEALQYRHRSVFEKT